MSDIRHFTDLRVWQRSHELFVQIAKLVDGFPPKRVSNVIADQILRSSGAIGGNIAEGFSASSTREYLRYLDIARRSANETENWLRNLQSLEILENQRFQELLGMCEEIRRMTIGLRKSLKSHAEA